MQDDSRLLGVTLARTGDIVQDERIETQAAVQAHEPKVLQLKTEWHSMAKLPAFMRRESWPKNSSSRAERNGAPERAVVLRRNPRLGHLQQARGQTHLRQQFVRIQVASADTLQRCGDEANGDGPRFRGPGRELPFGSAPGRCSYFTRYGFEPAACRYAAKASARRLNYGVAGIDDSRGNHDKQTRDASKSCTHRQNAARRQIHRIADQRMA